MFPSRTALRWLEYFLAACGVVLLVYCAASYWQSRLFQQEAAREFELPAVPFPGNTAERNRAIRNASPGSPVSRLDIPRLGISVVVVEGVEPANLKTAAGHVPGTAFPDEAGNVGIAAHRDTFFRGLSKIRPNDVLRLTTLSGEYEYSVQWTRIVKPTDVAVLSPTTEPSLTLVTCYPFYFVGPAPERWIVRATRIPETSH